MNDREPTSVDANPSLLASLAGLGRNLAGLLISRLELAALELGEMRATLVKLAVLAVLAILAAWFAVAFWTGLVVVLAWDTWGWKILLLFAVLFSAAMIGILAYVRSLLRQGKLSMSATAAELRKDRDTFLRNRQQP